LRHPDRKDIPAGINQQNQVISRPKFIPEEPVNLPAQAPGMIPLHCVPKFTGKGKGYPVIWQPVSEHKKLCPATGNSPLPAKNFPYFIPSL
jgi:hypothetical protein